MKVFDVGEPDREFPQADENNGPADPCTERKSRRRECMALRATGVRRGCVDACRRLCSTSCQRSF